MTGDPPVQLSGHRYDEYGEIGDIEDINCRISSDMLIRTGLPSSEISVRNSDFNFT